MTSPERLRPYRFHIGQDVRLRGLHATIHARLRSGAGRAMYAVHLAGEPGARHVLEEAIEAAEQMQVAA